MDIDRYLSRIKYRGNPTPTLETLCDLQKAHMFTVPFENLDIHAGRKIILESGNLFDKIVVRRRGGICYELNALFAMLLEAIGFKVRLLAAEVYADDGTIGRSFDHMALLVEINGNQFLSDVGFGDSFTVPLPLDSLEEQHERNDIFQIRSSETAYILMKRHASESGPNRPSFRFTTVPRNLGNFEEMCHFHQTSNESHFTRKDICSLATHEGRVSISGKQLSVTSGSSKIVTEFRTTDEKVHAFYQYFGIRV